MKEAASATPGLKTKLFWVLMGSVVTAIGFGAWLQSRAVADLLLALSGVLFIVSGFRSPIPLNVSLKETLRHQSENAERDHGLNTVALALLILGLLLKWSDIP
jgi:hypothetical protein